MPTYDYTCQDCGKKCEQFLPMELRDKPANCPSCRGDRLSRDVAGGCGVIFKGTGFYETDYKRKRK